MKAHSAIQLCLADKVLREIADEDTADKVLWEIADEDTAVSL